MKAFRLTWPEAMGQWVANGITMGGPAFKPLNLEVLWGGASLRHTEGTVLPGVAGRLPDDVLTDTTVRTVRMQIGGACDQDGTPHPTRAEGLEANVATVQSLGDPETWDGRSVLCEVTKPSGTKLAGYAQIEASEATYENGLAYVLLTVHIHGGRFSETGS